MKDKRRREGKCMKEAQLNVKKRNRKKKKKRKRRKCRKKEEV